MGVVITGLAIGITLALVFAPNLIELGGNVFGAEDAWRMPFLVLGAATLVVGYRRMAATSAARSAGLPVLAARRCTCCAYAAVSASPRSWPSTSSATRPG